MCGSQPCCRPVPHNSQQLNTNTTASTTSPVTLLAQTRQHCILDIIHVGYIDTNCILLADTTTKQGCIIDAGGDADLILQRIKHHNVTITHIYITHGHFDHFFSVGDLIAALQTEQPDVTVKLYMHEADLPLYHAFEQQLQWIPGSKPPATSPPNTLHTYAHNDTLLHGGVVLHTPGHSPGSVCLYWKEYCVIATGDTLFLANIGRTDLTGGDNKAIVRSIQTQLYTLPEPTLVVPGHMSLTSIQYEKYNNMFVTAKVGSSL